MLRIRKKTWGYWIFDLWVVLFTVLVFWALVAARHAAHTNRHLIRQNRTIIDNTDRKICVRINNINAIITGVLQRSRENIPKLAYYKKHPKELRAQTKEITQEIFQFRPRTCGKEVK